MRLFPPHLTQLKPKGFSLIELLVVATIIILLSTIGLVSYQQVSRNARNGKRKADLETIRQSLVLYRSDTGTYPVGSGGVSSANFTSAVDELNSANYLSDTNLVDPVNDTTYYYGYSSDGITFSVCGTLEPDATDYCLANP